MNILKLKRLVNESGITPAANQIEMNPYVFPHFCSHGRTKIPKLDISLNPNS